MITKAARPNWNGILGVPAAFLPKEALEVCSAPLRQALEDRSQVSREKLRAAMTRAGVAGVDPGREACRRRLELLKAAGN